MRSLRLLIPSEEPRQEGGGWEEEEETEGRELVLPTSLKARRMSPGSKNTTALLRKLQKMRTELWRLHLAWVGVARRPSGIQEKVEWLLEKDDSDV